MRAVNERPDRPIDHPDPAAADDPHEAMPGPLHGEIVMRHVAIRALTVGTTLSLLVATAAIADTLTADGDVVAPGNQGFVDLGQVAPGASVAVDVNFTLVCAGLAHVNPDQTLTLAQGPTGIPSDPTNTASASATAVTFAAPGAGWPLDNDGCPSGAVRTPSGPSRVTLVAPPAPGDNYQYTITWDKAFAPASADDARAISGMTIVTFPLDVVDNPPPQLHLPGAVELEGDAPGGAVAAYEVFATDAEDATAPIPTCTPAAGSVVPLGTTRVECSVTDLGGMTTTGEFDLTVVDTTAPVLVGVPDGLELTTPDTTGATLGFGLPSASDAVDESPAVSCTPAPGAKAPVGSSSVTCSATDASGNATTETFPVVVHLLTATWDSPVGGEPPVLVANPGRTVPIKVALALDGVAVTRGIVALSVETCDGSGTGVVVGLGWKPDAARWSGHLDTARLAGPGCYAATVILDGNAGPSFTLDLRGATAVRHPATQRAR